MLAILLVLVVILIFIYVKPQFFSSSLGSMEQSIEPIIYSNNYKLDLNAEERAWLKNNPVIKTGIDRAFPPFGSITSDYEYVGFTADFMRIIEHRLKIKLDIDKNASWNETIQMAKLGKLDVVAAIVNTKQRRSYLDFTTPFVKNPTVIINDAINNGYIGSLSNLKGKKVAIEEGSYVHGELFLQYPEIQLLPVKNTNLALSLVASEIADAYVGNAITASYLIKKFGYQNLSFSGETEYSSNHSIGIIKGNKLLLSIFQKALDSISIDSRKAISNHWFGMEVKENVNAETIVKLVAIFLFMLLILLAWILSLRKTKNELKRSKQLIQIEAEKDHLTGLGNRRKFYQLLETEIENAKKSGDAFSLVQLDIDKFKEINDIYGHTVGDLLIIEAAKRISNCVYDTNKLSRLSGDEFILILSGCKNKKEIEQFANKIKTNLSHLFYLEENEIITSVSMGITTFPYDAISQEQLLNNVDQALFHAKKTGRNRFSYFDSSMKSEAIIRNNTISDLRIAIKENQFELYYQPIIDLSSNKITKAEALIRWNHPSRGLIYPDKFIPLAEETGLIVDIGEWIFKQSVAETVKIKEIVGDDFQMSINTSPLQYAKNGMNVSEWYSHIVTSGLSGKDLTLEITEGVLMESSDTVKNKFYKLRDLDIQISIDDFGTGYSSLSYLKKFDIDFLKIDRSFVSNLSENSDDLVIIQTIIIMAHKLGCKVIAEGIEDETQRAILAQEGCDFGQGYYFSKPISATAFKQLLISKQEKNESSKVNPHVIPFKKTDLEVST